MTIEVFRDGQQWRWRIRAKRDNRELATSADAFGQRLDCIDAIRAPKIGLRGPRPRHQPGPAGDRGGVTGGA